MILIEQEARTKVCPLMSHQANQPGEGDKRSIQLCLASGCMKWRWGDNTGPEDLAWRKGEVLPKGYCGA